VDVWAAGILFYQLFTHEFPFDSSTPQSIMMFMMNKKLKRPSSVKDKVAWDLISKMLNFDRNKRLSAEKALSHEFFIGKKSNEGVTAEAVRLAQIAQTAKQNGNDKITVMETDAKFIIPVSDIKPILNVDPEAENEQLKKQINTRGSQSMTSLRQAETSPFSGIQSQSSLASRIQDPISFRPTQNPILPKTDNSIIQQQAQQSNSLHIYQSTPSIPSYQSSSQLNTSSPLKQDQKQTPEYKDKFVSRNDYSVIFPKVPKLEQPFQQQSIQQQPNQQQQPQQYPLIYPPPQPYRQNQVVQVEDNAQIICDLCHQKIKFSKYQAHADEHIAQRHQQSQSINWNSIQVDQQPESIVINYRQVVEILKGNNFQQQENECRNILSKFKDKIDDKEKENSIIAGVAQELTRIIENRNLSQITSIFIDAFFSLTIPANIELRPQLYAIKNPFPGLFRLLDSRNSEVILLAIKSIASMINGGISKLKTADPHPYFDNVSRLNGINKIFSIFRHNSDKQVKDTCAISIGRIFHEKEITNEEMKSNIIAHLKSILMDQDEWTSSQSILALGYLSWNSANLQEIEKDGFDLSDYTRRKNQDDDDSEDDKNDDDEDSEDDKID
ncbi:MAG: hypothetical protein EZS28_033130, partial [Streblomastix strix]